MTTLYPTDCCFCAELSGSTATDFHRRHGKTLSQRVIWRDEHFALFPTLGQLTQGHVLLIPIQHVNSFTRLPRELYGEAEGIIGQIRDMIGQAFSLPVCFEHGSGEGASSGGCGITHAHLHFVPLGGKLIEDLPNAKNWSWNPLPEEGWLATIEMLIGTGHPYLFYQTAGGARWTTAIQSLPSQYMRCWMADRLMYPNWDWRDATAELPILETLQRLGAVRVDVTTPEASTC